MYAYLNGTYLPLAAARVSVLDRGFLFGDGVYELIPVYDGQLFALDRHLARLDQSLRAIDMPNPHEAGEWAACLEHLVRLGGEGDLALYVQVTRGAAPRDHAYPLENRPTVFAMVNPLQSASADQLSQGVSALTASDIRWQRCDIKSINLLPNIMLRQQAREAGAVEAILIREGRITEGAASNVFVVQAGVAVTPPLGPALLPGVTRGLVLELLTQYRLPHEVRVVDLDDLRTASEIWLTSSSKGVLPVTRLDGKPVGTGYPGSFWARVHQAYQTLQPNPEA